jgi:hypothetical protein
MTTKNTTRTERRLMDSIRKAKSGTEQPTETAAAKQPDPKSEAASASKTSPAPRSTRQRSPAKLSTVAKTRATSTARESRISTDSAGSESGGAFIGTRRVWPD